MRGGRDSACESHQSYHSMSLFTCLAVSDDNVACAVGFLLDVAVRLVKDHTVFVDGAQWYPMIIWPCGRRDFVGHRWRRVEDSL